MAILRDWRNYAVDLDLSARGVSSISCEYCDHKAVVKMSAEFAEALVIHRRAGRRIEFLSIAWTAIESIVGVIFGVLAGSVALISFGIDSVMSCAKRSAACADSPAPTNTEPNRLSNLTISY